MESHERPLTLWCPLLSVRFFFFIFLFFDLLRHLYSYQKTNVDSFHDVVYLISTSHLHVLLESNLSFCSLSIYPLTFIYEFGSVEHSYDGLLNNLTCF